MTEEARLHRTIGDIYEAALSPEGDSVLSASLWNSAAGSSGALIAFQQSSGRVRRTLGMTANFDDDAMARYDAYFYCRNAWRLRIQHLPPPPVVQGSALIPLPALLRTEFYTDWCQPLGICHMVGTLHSISDDVVLAGSIYRDRNEADFTEEERDRLGMVAAHVARAVAIAERLGVRDDVSGFSLALLESLKVAVIFVDASFRTVLANAAAERVLGTGQWLSAAGGRLRAAAGTRAPGFDRLMHDTAETGRAGGLSSGGICRLADRRGRVLPVLVAPIRLPLAFNRLSAAVAAIVFAEPDRHAAEDAAALAAAFGLTGREGALLAALVAGRSLAQHAASNGVSINTVRTQLASIFAKTGHARQSTLVAAASGHPVVRLASTTNGQDAGVD